MLPVRRRWASARKVRGALSVWENRPNMDGQGSHLSEGGHECWRIVVKSAWRAEAKLAAGPPRPRISVSRSFGNAAKSVNIARIGLSKNTTSHGFASGPASHGNSVVRQDFLFDVGPNPKGSGASTRKPMRSCQV